MAGAWWHRLWPSPQPEEEVNPPAIFLTYENALSRIRAVHDGAFRSTLFDLAGQLYRSELERRRHTEARSSAILTAAGIAVALAGGLLGLFGKELATMTMPWNLIVLCLFVVASVYQLGALIAILRVYGPAPISIMDPVDLAPIEDETDLAYRERYSCRSIEYTIQNYKENNRVLQSLFASRDRLRNAIFLFAGVLLFVAVRLFVDLLSRAAPGCAPLL